MNTGMLLHVLSAYLFVMGLLAVMLRRNSMIILMGIELMLNAVNLSFVTFAREWGQIDGQIQVFFVITVAAAESAVGLSILLQLYRTHGSIKTDRATEMKG